MFVIKCHNDATGRTETVSKPIADITSAETGDNLNRRNTVEQFAHEDTCTDHTYFCVTVSA